MSKDLKNKDNIEKYTDIQKLYSLSRYKEEFFLQDLDDEIILFNYINDITKRFNSPMLHYISTLDESIEQGDIESELYLQGLKHIRKNGINDYTSFTLRDDLINIMNKLKAKKRKGFTSTLKEEYYNTETLSETYDFDSIIFLENLLSSISEEEKKILIKYYIEGYTYEQITEHSNIKTKRGIKKKIDTIINKVRNNI